MRFWPAHLEKPAGRFLSGSPFTPMFFSVFERERGDKMAATVRVPPPPPHHPPAHARVRQTAQGRAVITPLPGLFSRAPNETGTAGCRCVPVNARNAGNACLPPRFARAHWRLAGNLDSESHTAAAVRHKAGLAADAGSACRGP